MLINKLWKNNVGKAYDINQLFLAAKGIDYDNGINIIFLKVIRANSPPMREFQQMIDLGADPNYDLQETLFCACSSTEPDLLLYLLDRYQINLADMQTTNLRNFYSLYSNAISNPSTAILKVFLDAEIKCTEHLLKHTPSINTTTFELFTKYDVDPNLLLKMCASRVEWGKIYDYIISNLNQISPKLLDLIIQRYIYVMSLDQVKLFIGNAETLSNFSICSYLIQSTNKELMQILEYFYQMGILDTNNSFHLLNAINYDNEQCVNYLLNIGMPITHTAIQTLVSHPKYIRLFIQYGANVDIIAKECCKDFRLDTAKILLEYGVDFNQIILNC